MSLREDLDKIPWQQLQHAYGSAEDTPEQLLALLSSDTEAREAALEHLWTSICHQGSVYEASCAAIPFLIQILEQEPDNKKKLDILYLLAGLAHRDWYADRDRQILRMDHHLDSPTRDRQIRRSWGQFLQQGNEYHRPEWMQRAHTLVGNGLPIYRALLTTGTPETAISTLYLLSAFRELGDAAIADVEAVRSHSDNIHIVASSLLFMGALLDAESPSWERYRLDATDDAQRHPLVRFAMALSVALYHPQSASPAARNVLAQAMSDSGEVNRLYRQLPWCESSTFKDACMALCRLGTPEGLIGLIAALAGGASKWPILDTVRVAEALLDVAFFGDWVQGRYWSCPAAWFDEEESAHLVKKSAFYFDFGRYSYGEGFHGTKEPRITCAGYDRYEAERWQQRFANERSQALSTHQQQAITAVLDCEPLWRFDTDLFSIYGLPTEKAALRQLVGRR